MLKCPRLDDKLIKIDFIEEGIHFVVLDVTQRFIVDCPVICKIVF